MKYIGIAKAGIQIAARKAKISIYSYSSECAIFLGNATIIKEIRIGPVWKGLGAIKALIIEACDESCPSAKEI